VLFGCPGFAPLTFSRKLAMRKEYLSVLYKGLTLRQTRPLYLLPGIVIGAINRLQFNEWRPYGIWGKCLWQLIAIFDEVNIKQKQNTLNIWNNWQY
jgi:hypothetical protein